RFVGDGDFVGVVATAADQPFFSLEVGDAFFGVEAEQPLNFGHDFRPDTIAREKKEFESRHEARLTGNEARLLKPRARLGKPRGIQKKTGLYCPLNQL